MVGEMSVRGNVLVGKCPVGEVSGRGIVRSGKCPSGKCQSGICPRGSVRPVNCPTIYISCLDKVLENLTNKIQSFERFKNFRHFWVFVLSYRANSKRRKRWKIPNLVES